MVSWALDWRVIEPPVDIDNDDAIGKVETFPGILTISVFDGTIFGLQFVNVFQDAEVFPVQVTVGNEIETLSIAAGACAPLELSFVHSKISLIVVPAKELKFNVVEV